jgi:hypothetical protein
VSAAVSAGATSLQVELLPGAAELLAAHARELPQRDDICGAFCGALALAGASLTVAPDGGPLDQDAVAVMAGSVVSAVPEPQILPAGEGGRRDNRLAIPQTTGEEESGTNAAGVVAALAALGGAQAEPVPLAGAWSAATVRAIFDVARGLSRPASLIANLHTSHLWGSHPSPGQLLGALLDGGEEGPAPDWSVGHFVCVVGRVDGPRGSLYVLADTYPALGDRGVHLQPEGRLAAALARPEHPEGGVIALVHPTDAQALRESATAVGLSERLWDNGSASALRGGSG